MGGLLCYEQDIELLIFDQSLTARSVEGGVVYIAPDGSRVPIQKITYMNGKPRFYPFARYEQVIMK